MKGYLFKFHAMPLTTNLVKAYVKELNTANDPDTLEAIVLFSSVAPTDDEIAAIATF